MRLLIGTFSPRCASDIFIPCPDYGRFQPHLSKIYVMLFIGFATCEHSSDRDFRRIPNPLRRLVSDVRRGTELCLLIGVLGVSPKKSLLNAKLRFTILSAPMYKMATELMRCKLQLALFAKTEHNFFNTVWAKLTQSFLIRRKIQLRQTTHHLRCRNHLRRTQHHRRRCPPQSHHRLPLLRPNNLRHPSN